MAVILKYQLENISGQKVKVPLGAHVLSVGVQNESLCMWVACPTNTNKTMDVEVLIFATGFQQVPNDIFSTHYFMGTHMLNFGRFTTHVFVCKVAPESVEGD